MTEPYTGALSLLLGDDAAFTAAGLTADLAGAHRWRDGARSLRRWLDNQLTTDEARLFDERLIELDALVDALDQRERARLRVLLGEETLEAVECLALLEMTSP